MTSSPFYPIYLNLRGKPVLLVGAGKVGYEKALKLVEAQACLTVISPEIREEFYKMPGVVLHKRKFEVSDIAPFFLVIGATSDSEVNRLIYESCEKENKLVNIVDVPELCRFIVPALIRRGDLLISVSSGGRAPFYTKVLAQQLREQFSDAYAEYVEILGEGRDLVKETFKTMRERGPCLQALLASDIKDLVFSGNSNAARERIKEVIHAFAKK